MACSSVVGWAKQWLSLLLFCFWMSVVATHREIKLVDIKPEDLPLWKEMRRQVYGDLDDAFDDQEMQSISTRQDWWCKWIEIQPDLKIGLVEMSFRNVVDGCLTSPVAYLEGFYIQPHYRHQGIGKQVITMLLSWCSASGYAEFATDAELENTRAQKFYESLGFEEVDRVVSYRISTHQF